MFCGGDRISTPLHQNLGDFLKFLEAFTPENKRFQVWGSPGAVLSNRSERFYTYAGFLAAK